MFPLFQICKTYYPMVLAFIVQQLFAKKRQSSELFWNKLEIGTYTPYDPYICKKKVLRCAYVGFWENAKKLLKTF